MFLSCLTLQAQPSSQERFVKGRLLVRFAPSVLAGQAQDIIQSMQARRLEELPGIGVHVIQLPANASEVAFQNAFRQRSDVEFAELDHIRAHQQSTSVTPNDPEFAGEWHLAKIGAPQAWSVTTGSPGIIVAIADTGVDSTHPDLVSKMVAGWNVTNNNSDTRDVYGHGTMVAGTVAAASNNGIGVASIAWNCWIMPVRISQADGMAYDSTIASGITWAADHGARVVNVSYQVTGSGTVSAAAKYMAGKGGVVTVSAGNYSTFDSIANDPYMITVGASDPSDAMYSWSNTGTDIDLVAPGCVTTTANGGGYTGACGTSFSAPVVAGVAALVMSSKPGLTASQITSILQSSADDLGSPGWDSTYGSGRVNAARAVSGSSGVTADTQAPNVSFAAPLAGVVLSGTVSIQVSATDNVGVTALKITANGSTIGSSANFNWNTTSWPNGSYSLVATATDAAGNTASTSRSVTINNANVSVSDTTPPTVAITSPLSGAITGVATLTATAADNVGITKVQYYLDGALVGTATASPYSVKLNTKKVSSGAHSLLAKAYDAAGNVGTSGVVQVAVK
jgi:thermitase